MIGQVAVYYGLYGLQLVAAFAVIDAADVSGLGILELMWWGALFAVGLRCGHQHGRQPNKNYEQTSNGVALLGLLVFFVKLTTAGLIPALLSLALWAQAALNFTLAKRQGYYFALVITFTLVLFSAATSKSGFFLFTLTLYVLAAIFTLYAHYLDQRNAAVSQHAEELGKLPWAGPVLGISAVIVALAVVVYLAVPRPPALHYGAFASNGGHDYQNDKWEDDAEKGADAATRSKTAEADSAGEGGQGEGEGKPRETKRRDKRDTARGSGFDYAGFDEQFDIRAPGDSRLSNAIVLYLHADRPLYLKGEVFDTFDGKVWSQADHRNKKHRLENGEYTVPAVEDGAGEPVFQEITVAQDLTDILFTAERLHQVTFPGSVLQRDAYGGLRAPARIKMNTVYSAESRIAYIEGRPAGGPVAAGDVSAYLQLPADLSARTGELAAQVTEAEHLPLEKARALELYLRTQYRYTFDTVLDDDDAIPVEHFLFETREGHCEFFATAMTLMLRTLGIPTRLVTGFSATNLNPMTGYYEVRGLDAHAWVEAYFPEHGWVLFEPTAFYNLPEPEASNDVPESITSYANRLVDLARTIDPDAPGTNWLSLWAAVLNGIGALWHSAVNGLLSIWNGVVAWLLGGGVFAVAAALSLGAGGYFGRHALRARWALLQLRRTKKDDAPLLVRRAYEAMENYFDGKGLARDPAWTVTEYHWQLRERFPGKAACVGVIADHYTHWRYGREVPDPAVAAEVVESFERLVRGEV